ncbi:MAG: di-heme oxidoredictase family protein [Gemmatimonadota bacterium]
MTRSLRSRLVGWTLFVLLLSLGCARADDVPGAAAGRPWPGLSAADSGAFVLGAALFDREFTAAQGLGPTFNDRRCSSCHDLPVLGGFGADPVRKATRFEDGRCDLLVEDGGDMFQTGVTPALRAHGFDAEPISRRANAIASITAPVLYGLGAIEAIPDEAILSRADPDDRDRDGISGRAGQAFDGQLGRFGRKATFATIRSFVEGALSGEMGLTTQRFPQEERIGGQALPAGVDPVADPEVDSASVLLLTRFVTLLARVAADSVSPASADTISEGRLLFERIGCASCHAPRLETGPNPVAALNRRSVPLYSDLLLHDLGPELASVCAPHAGPSEWRTSPLMGLHLRHEMLHDGRASRVEAAIGLHGGEATGSRRRFQALPPEQQAALLRFLRTL